MPAVYSSLYKLYKHNKNVTVCKLLSDSDIVDILNNINQLCHRVSQPEDTQRLASSIFKALKGIVLLNMII